jgi:hypothetical protein
MRSSLEALRPMKNFAYFCTGICALCLGASSLIFAIKYQPPKPSALDAMQEAITRQFTEGFENGLKEARPQEE